MKNNKLLTAFFVGVAAVFFLTGVAIACQAAKLGRFVGGTEVEGTVYNYAVRHSSRGGNGGYHCFLFCRYVDDAGRNWAVEFQYGFTKLSHSDAEKRGEEWLNKPIKMYLKGSDCVSEVEMERYLPLVGISVALFCAGATTVVAPLTVKAVRKRHAKSVALSEEDYLL